MTPRFHGNGNKYGRDVARSGHNSQAMRRAIYGPIVPMEEPRGWLARLIRRK